MTNQPFWFKFLDSPLLILTRGYLHLLWKGGFQLRGGLRGTVTTWPFTDALPRFRSWIVGPVEIRWILSSGPPSDDELYFPAGTKLRQTSITTVMDPILRRLVLDGLHGDTSRLPIGCRISADKKMEFFFGDEKPEPGEKHAEMAYGVVRR